VTDVLFRATI